jgi:CRISPR-associated protein Cas2
MHILVAYDVNTTTPEGERRLRRVAQVCLGFGQRVQQSVFECSVTEALYEKLKDRLLKEIDPSQDNLRLYRLPEPKDRFRECFGVQREIDLEGPLVV